MEALLLAPGPVPDARIEFESVGFSEAVPGLDPWNPLRGNAEDTVLLRLLEDLEAHQDAFDPQDIFETLTEPGEPEEERRREVIGRRCLPGPML